MKKFRYIIKYLFSVIRLFGFFPLVNLFNQTLKVFYIIYLQILRRFIPICYYFCSLIILGFAYSIIIQLFVECQVNFIAFGNVLYDCSCAIWVKSKRYCAGEARRPARFSSPVSGILCENDQPTVNEPICLFLGPVQK